MGVVVLRRHNELNIWQIGVGMAENGQKTSQRCAKTTKTALFLLSVLNCENL